MPQVLLAFHELKTEDDLVLARAAIKMHAADLGFSALNQTKIVTAASELGRNTIEHGLGGNVTIEHVQEPHSGGIRLVFKDSGPGIPDLAQALVDGFTSKKGLGLGLSGSKRLMDEFVVASPAEGGTLITVTKWM